MNMQLPPYSDNIYYNNSKHNNSSIFYNYKKKNNVNIQLPAQHEQVRANISDNDDKS